MKRWIVLVALSFAIGNRGEAAASPEAPRILRVVMPYFSSDDNLYRSIEVGEHFSAAVQAKLAKMTNVAWAEREQLTLAEEEFHLQHSGFTEGELRLGHWLKADLLVRGIFVRTHSNSRLLKIEIIDAQRANVLATRELTVPGEARDPVSFNAADIDHVASEISSAIEEARQVLSVGDQKRKMAALYFHNLSPTHRLDFLESDILDQFERAGALRFSRASESFAEAELSVLGLTDGAPDSWKKVADAYLWGNYEELPAKEETFDQIQVAVTFNIWDGITLPQSLEATGTVAELPSIISNLVGLAQTTVNSRRAGERSDIGRDRGAAALLQYAQGLSNPARRAQTLEVAAFFAPQSEPIRRALLDAREKISGTDYRALNQKATDRERYLTSFPPQSNSDAAQLLKNLGGAYDDLLIALHHRRDDTTVFPDLPDSIAEKWESDVANRIVEINDHLLQALPAAHFPDDLLYNVLECVEDPKERLRAVKALWPAFKPDYIKYAVDMNRQGYVMRNIEDRLYRACADAGEPDLIMSLIDFDASQIKTSAVARIEVPAAMPSRTNAVPVVKPVRDYVAAWHKRNADVSQTARAKEIAVGSTLPELTLASRALFLDRDTATISDRVNEHNVVVAMTMANGRLWISAEPFQRFSRPGNASLYRYDPANDELTMVPVPGRVTAMASDNGSLWLAATGHGLLRLNPESGTMTNFTSRDGLLTENFSFIAKANGQLLFGGDVPKLNTFDPVTGKWGDLETDNTHGSAVGYDHWLFFRQVGGSLVDVNTRSTSQPLVSGTAVTADTTGYWIAGDRELVHFNPGTGGLKRWPSPLPHTTHMVVDGQFLWLGAGSRVALWDISSGQCRGALTVEGSITSLAVTPGRLWIGCDMGPRSILDTGRDHEMNPVIEVESPTKASGDGSPSDLWHAAYQGRVDEVDKFLAGDEGANVETKRGWTPLMAAIRGRQIEVVKHLLSHGAKVTPGALVLAAELGHMDLLEPLLQGAPPLDYPYDGKTPFLAAVAADHIDVVRRLMTAGADITRTSRDGNTALQLAISTGNRDIVLLLLEKRSKPDPNPSELTQAVTLAAERGATNIVETLLERGASPDGPPGTKTLLMQAAESDNPSLVRLALKYGSKIDAQEVTRLAIGSDRTVWIIRRTALTCAASRGHLEMMDLLMANGLGPNLSLGGMTMGGQALIRAAAANQVAAVEKLLHMGIPIDVTDENGMTALMWAAKNSATAATQLLIEQGANLQLRNRQGQTPLEMAGNTEIRSVLGTSTDASIAMPTTTSNVVVKSNWLLNYKLARAVEMGDSDSVNHLLQAGADANTSVPDDCPVIFRAVVSGRDPVIQSLLQHGAAANATSVADWTALMLAARNNQQSIVHELLSHGASVGKENRWGQTALDIARSNGNKDVASMLEYAASNKSNGWMLIDVVRMRNPALVSLLLGDGEPVDGVDGEDRTALFHAVHDYRENNNFYRINEQAALQTVEALLAKGADVNHVSKDGRTPLMEAITERESISFELIKSLLEHGARLDMRDKDGATAFELAGAIRNAGVRDLVVRLLQTVRKPLDSSPQIPANSR